MVYSRSLTFSIYIFFSFSHLEALEQLRLSQNKLTLIPNSFGDGALSKTLKELWVDRNNLIELNTTFPHLTKLEDIRCDYNPMRSPPLELFRLGFARIKEYMEDRMQRIVALKEAIPNLFQTIEADRRALVKSASDNSVEKIKEVIASVRFNYDACTHYN